MTTSNAILTALAFGILPAILWLLFWLKEDSKHPESPFLISKAFLCGMLVVVLVIPFQKVVDDVFPGMSPAAFLLWAIIEEGFKFAMAYFIAIRVRDDDEPIDAMIYMIAVALGFVALENTFFLFHPLLQRDIVVAVSLGNLRFIGASLLHVVSSATIGLALSLSFYKKTSVRVVWTSLAFMIAVLIHAAFNIFILNRTGLTSFIIFGLVWFGVGLILLAFEKAKTVAP